MTSDASPQVLARIIGLLYLFTIAAGRIAAEGATAAAATNILAHKALFQAGFTVYLIEMICQIAQVTLFYILLIALVGSAPQILGLFIKGVNVEQWKKFAAEYAG